jgi:acetyl esterase/lipase
MIRRIGVLALFLISACGVVWGDEPNLKHDRDVIYGRKFGTCLSMDVISPKSNSNHRGLIFVVSGGWTSNHETIEGFGVKLGAGFVQRGYTIFAVVHGSQPKFTIPEAIEDMHRAVRYIRANAKRFDIDADHIGIFGASAGCHLSLMQGVGGKPGNPKAADLVDRQSSAVQAVSGFFPPTDFFNYGKEGASAEEVIKLIPAPFDFRNYDVKKRAFVTVSPEERKEILRAISPVYHVTDKTPPTLLVHGDKDKLVPLQQSEVMIAKLNEHKVPCKLIVKEGADHGGPPFEKELPTLIDWFDKYLK